MRKVGASTLGIGHEGRLLKFHQKVEEGRRHREEKDRKRNKKSEERKRKGIAKERRYRKKEDGKKEEEHPKKTTMALALLNFEERATIIWTRCQVASFFLPRLPQIRYNGEIDKTHFSSSSDLFKRRSSKKKSDMASERQQIISAPHLISPER